MSDTEIKGESNILSFAEAQLPKLERELIHWVRAAFVPEDVEEVNGKTLAVTFKLNPNKAHSHQAVIQALESLHFTEDLIFNAEDLSAIRYWIIDNYPKKYSHNRPKL